MREDKKIPKKAPPLSPTALKLIKIESLRWPRIPRDALASALAEKIAALDGGKPPTEDTLKRRISEVRASELPEPLYWHLGLSVQHDIPPEAIPKIFRIQAMLREEWKVDGRLLLPIAEWIGQLHAAIDSHYDLYIAAATYALFEIVDAIAKVKPDDAADLPPADTTELDALLAKRDFLGLHAKLVELKSILPFFDGSTPLRDERLQDRARDYMSKQNGGTK